MTFVYAAITILLSTIAVLPSAYTADTGVRGSVAILASERISGNWVRSYYNSILNDEVGMNECELMLGERFENSGFSVAKPRVEDSQKKDVRKMMVVFGRYNDMSSIPNDIVVKAASMAGLKSDSVIACGVYVTGKKKKQKVCANAGCKAVDMRTKRRISAVAKEKCLPDSEQVNIGIATIRDVCSEAGDALAGALAK